MSKIIRFTRKHLPREYTVPIVLEGRKIGEVIEYQGTAVTYTYWEPRPFFSEHTLTFKRRSDAKRFVKWCRDAVPDYTIYDKQ